VNNKTHSVKLNEIEKKWYIIDAANKPLGRVSTEVARLLRGKHKPTFSAHIDCGDHVIVINTDNMILTGDKLNQKMFRRHSGYIGGLKETPYKTMMDNKSDLVLLHAVKGMLPKNSLGRKMLTKVRAYKKSEHDQQAQQPEIWNF